MRARTLTARHKANIGAGLIGHDVSTETRAKISAAHLGRKHSAEARANMSAAHIGKTGTPRLKTETFRCATCAAEITLQGAARSVARSRGRAYCGDSCRDDGWRAGQSASHKDRPLSAETRAKLSMALKGRKVQWGRKHGPHSVKTRAKISAAKIGKHHGRRTPGTGGYPTPMEARLLSYLPTNWLLHYKIPGLKNGCIVDIVEPELKIAVEIDGPIHRQSIQRARDIAKTEFLTARGWMVMRCTNKAVAENVVLQSKICEMLADVRRAA